MDFKALKNLAYLTQIAFLMLTPIIGGVFIGNWLDEHFNTSPWLLLVCIILGVGTAFMSLYKFVMKVTKNDDEDTKE
ncbi:MAG: AtpZ/AtpI family protein [Clostridia bacterium]|nr:AtpZ/AtpI family protein [Clostridia bacterium]